MNFSLDKALDELESKHKDLIVELTDKISDILKDELHTVGMAVLRVSVVKMIDGLRDDKQGLLQQYIYKRFIGTAMANLIHIGVFPKENIVFQFCPEKKNPTVISHGPKGMQ